MDDATTQACMKMAIEVAKRSRAEDGRPHPYVGALLTDLDGVPLSEMARGEAGDGVHAEAGLIDAALRKGIDLSHTILFATLEPCTWRSRAHEPCALRVQRAGIPIVYIGMIDPDLRICGRGESFLSLYTRVERFPAIYRDQILEVDKSFVNAKKYALIWAVRTYGINPTDAGPRPRLSMLHLTQETILQSRGDIWISGGDLSWLRELSPVLLRAGLDGRQIRLLCNREISAITRREALALGVTLAAARPPWPFRGTIVNPKSNDAVILVVDSGDIHKLGCPEDMKLVSSITQAFDERRQDEETGTLKIRTIPIEQLQEALETQVPQYSGTHIEYRSVDIGRLRPLPSTLEEFKLARWDLLSRTIERHNLPAAFVVEGQEWPCTPPVVEIYPDGMHVIIDGAHRVYSAHMRGQTTISAFVVAMPDHATFPAIPRAGWNEVSRSYEKIPRNHRYDTYREDEFRPIRQAFQSAIKAQG